MLQQLLGGLPRKIKIAVMVVVDAVLLALAMWLGLSLRYGYTWLPITSGHAIAMLAAVSSGVAAFAVLGLYRWMVRYVSADTVFLILKALSLSSLLLGSVMLFLRIDLPRSTPLLYLLVAGFLIVASRFVAQRLLRFAEGKDRIPVVIFGAGSTGSQLALSLHQSYEYRPVAFVDAKKGIHGMMLYGLRVFDPSELPRLVTEYGVRQIMLAIPSLSNSRRREILLQLEPLSLKVRTVPRLSDILEGRARPDEIKDVDVEDLLSRDPVPPRYDLLSAKITGKNVLITGAGGSIGSELCRQIVMLQPEVLVMYEQSEFALYSIEQELRKLMSRKPEQTWPILVSVLGSVQKKERLESALRCYHVHTAFHAAAYKHVPLVEYNVVEGVFNNVFGTRNAAEAARAAGVETFVLISTDKAVRPTNIMGASKRFAELILQSMAKENQVSGAPASGTCFCMVRFGNVLGSSGSVVPLFAEQIRRGGPVTVTHPDVIRYFMTIPEAAQLVVQAAAMATGGDVFLLDMGEPVRIADLARHMIHLMGFQTRSERAPDGVAVEFTGLRPGEKLYEELLVGGGDSPTEHPRIRRAFEQVLTSAEVSKALDALMRSCETSDIPAIYALFSRIGIGFVSPGKPVDVLSVRMS